MDTQLPAVIAAAGEALPVAAADRLDTRARDYALAEKAEATRLAYRSDLALFAAWCDTRGVAAVRASPASVANYLTHLADAGLSAATVSRRAAAIAYAHKLAGFEPPTNAETVRATLRGIRRTLGTEPDRKAPATADVMGELLAQVPRETLLGLRDRALLLVGFAAALRRSELVGLDVADLDFAREGLWLRLGKSKTDQEGAGTTVPVPNGAKLKPVAALKGWLEAAALTEGAVFRRIRRGDRLGAERLSAAAVAEIVKRYAGPAGLAIEDFAGHSLRAGFATEALATGADIFKVMDQTRHRKIETLKIYDRRAKAFRNHAGKGFL